MKKLCPFGHRVHVLKAPHAGKGHCEECENIYPASFLVHVVDGVRKNQHRLYATAYREGYKAAVRRQREVAETIIDVSSSRGVAVVVEGGE